MRTLLLTTVFALVPVSALAQSIETGQLGAAQAYDAALLMRALAGWMPLYGKELLLKRLCA